ncbi:MAG: hypothetical protein RB296_07625 [Acidobacteriota bacterium]|nr:hypothetical protein [Acidobacteriota bacterium]
MKRITIVCLSVFLTAAMVLPAQSLNLKVGLFIPFMESDLWDINRANLEFEKADMVDLYYGIEYEWLMSEQLSLAFEGGIYKKEKRSYYRDFEFDDFSLIPQNLSLRITSLEATIKLYPIGRRHTFYPFLALGGGLYAWKYEQWGYFIDNQDFSVYEGYSDSAKFSPGLTGKAGMVLRLGRNTGISLEARYLYLKDELGELFEGFETFDMRGLSINAGIHFFLW